MKLVQEEREHPGVRLLRRALLVSFAFYRRYVASGARQWVELDRIKRLRDAVFQQLEIGRTKVENGAPLRVGHDSVNSDARDVAVHA